MSYSSFSRLVVKASLFAASGAVLSAATVISIFVTPGPTVTSPSYNSFLANALAGIQGGGIATGTPGTPSYWAPVAQIQPQFLLDTTTAPTINSWQGVINPASPFNNELGTDLYFGLLVTTTGGTEVELDGMQFGQITLGALGSIGPFTYGTGNGDTYSTISSGGLISAKNGVTPVTGAATLRATEIDYTGAQIGLPLDCSPSQCTQTDMDDAIAYILGLNLGNVPYSYTINEFDAPTGSEISPVEGPGNTPLGAEVPEPATWSMLLLGLGTVAYGKLRSR